MPDGRQSLQCMGATAQWMTAAPMEATAAQRAASGLSVHFASLKTTASTLAQRTGPDEQRRITVRCRIGYGVRSVLPANGQL